MIRIEEDVLERRYVDSAAFHENFLRTDVRKSAIFGERKKLMDEIWDSGIPVLVDQSYYHHEAYLFPLEKKGDSYVCGSYKKFEEWRDCHYYSLYQSASGMKVWLMSGGRYD